MQVVVCLIAAARSWDELEGWLVFEVAVVGAMTCGVRFERSTRVTVVSGRDIG